MKRIGERLIEAGLVSAESVEQGLAHQKITGHRIGDCLVELGLIQENALLRFLAQMFNTRFVSAEKLAKAVIAPQVLEKVPVRMAEAQDFLPIAYDADRRILSIVMAEPQNTALTREIALVTEMQEVNAFVGVRAAIQAGIKKHYYGDPTAFQALEQGGVQSLPASMHGRYEGADSRMAVLPGMPGPSSPSGVLGATSSSSGRSSARINPSQLREALGMVRGAVAENDYLETLNILVSLIESSRHELRGHSAQVARQAELIARRIGLQPRDVAHTSIAAYLHDIGKRADKHFTLPSLAMQPDHRSEAKRAAKAPIKLFETVHLPPAVNAILAHVYEAFDGSGVPLGAKAEDIPAPARIIAAVDAFLDLTRNPGNPFGRIMAKEEALAYLHQQASTLFDPVVVDTLAALQSGDLLRQRVVNDGRQIFVADPDEATRTDLVDSLVRLGLVVQTVVKLDGIIDAALSNEADTLVVGLGYGVSDLVAMTQFIRARPESASVPVLVLGDPTDPVSRERLVGVGVTAFLPMPLSPDEASIIVRGAFIDRIEFGGPGRLVRGNFDELASTDLIGILGSGQKSGRLLIRNGPQEGHLQLERGRVVYAQFGEKKGEPAISALLTVPQAEFQYDPESMLADMPNVDLNLDVIARQLGPVA